VTAQQIIDEIKRLPLRTTRRDPFCISARCWAPTQRGGAFEVAARMSETDAVEPATIRDTIVRGFYGAEL
jgi:hypothetical protein